MNYFGKHLLLQEKKFILRKPEYVTDGYDNANTQYRWVYRVGSHSISRGDSRS